ncbi:MAG: DNA polymerase III subunit delta [Chloroflexota bacterium]
MLYILSGQDDFSLARTLDEIKKSLDAPGTLTVNTTTLDSRVTLDNLRNVCSAAPFLGGKRLVIIEGLLERFQPGEKSGRKKTAQPTTQPDESKSFGNCLTNLPDSTIVVLTDGEIKNHSSNPLFRELSPKATVKLFPLLKGTQLRQRVQERIVKEGVNISSQAVDLLIRRVGSDLWAMSGEINKLITFTSGRRIEEDDVKKVVSNVQHNDIFDLVDAIIEFKVNTAQQVLEELLHKGAAPTYVLSMITRQAEFIVRAKALKKQGKSDIEIQGKLGLTHWFAVRKTLDQAAKYTLPRLREVYHRLLDTDIAIKTGRYDDELALNILVAELCSKRAE